MWIAGPVNVFRKSFLWLAIGGLIVNLGFDYLAFRTKKSSDASSERVVEAYDVSLQLQKLERSINSLLLNEQSKGDVIKGAKALGQIVKVDHQRFLLRQLATRIESNSAQEARAVIEEILDLQSEFVERTLAADLERNHQVNSALFNGFAIDALLIALLFACFLAEQRARRKTETNLLQSLFSLRETIQSLQEERLRRSASLKTTVHDLKNPLGSIHGFADLISDDVKKTSSIQESSEIIKRISQSALELVDSILSRSEETPFEMERLDLLPVLIDLCSQNEPLAKMKGQTIIREFRCPAAWVNGNRMRLEELFTNVLGNAIKYSPIETSIRIRCWIEREVIRVELLDSGPGFSRDDRQKAFQYGQLLSAKPTGTESSTGYGLFIAKQIVDQHRGRIGITDAYPENGACVFFEIPIANVESAKFSHERGIGEQSADRHPAP